MGLSLAGASEDEEAGGWERQKSKAGEEMDI